MEPFAEGVRQLPEDASSWGIFPCKWSLAPGQDACKVLDPSQGDAEGKGLHTSLQRQAPPGPLMPSSAGAASRSHPFSQGRMEQGFPLCQRFSCKELRHPFVDSWGNNLGSSRDGWTQARLSPAGAPA